MTSLAAPKQLSLMAYEFLDQLGLSDEIRKLYRENAYTQEISYNLTGGDSLKFYFFGSSIEGTKIPGMNSDMDLACIEQTIEVFTKCSSTGGKAGIIVVQDETTPPGHVKLQLIYDNKPLQGTNGLGGLMLDKMNTSLLPRGEYRYLPDDKGRIVITVQPGFMLPIPNVTKHGVAFKQDNKGELPDIDYVLAFQSKVLPDCVSDCLTRKRNSYFLTPKVVEACKSYGCLFVPKEHWQSKDSRLLWRISPSHQERFLMFNFNSVQHKCYVLLKLIKKDIINPALGSEVLTSYHCKTAMLHLIDMTPSQFWRPDNLLFCLITALHCLLLWSMDRNCPNFFIPDENMFRWRISRHLLKKLSDELFRLISLDFVSLLRSIKTVPFNHGLEMVRADNSQCNRTLYDFAPYIKAKLSSEILLTIMCERYVLVLECYSHYTNDLVNNLSSQLSNLLVHTDRTDIHSPVNHTRRTIALLAPYIEIYLLSNIVALSVKRGDARETTWGYLTRVRWQEISHSSDLFTSRLKQASLMSALGYHRHSFNVLSTIENKVSLNDCGCYWKPPKLLNLELVLLRLSTDEILHRFWTPCVLFLPTEQGVVPPALCYEMSITEAPADPYSWHDHWAIVDGTFLLHFLLYLNRKNLGLSFEADIQVMEKYLKSERYLKHIDTDLNLLGWVYKQEGKMDMAYECFKKSLHFRPQQKAAIWHILCLISSLRL